MANHMDETTMVRCALHGLKPRTNVCQHIVTGLARGERVGFFWTATQHGNPRPDAWCRECEKRVNLTRGQWIGEALEQVGARILCSGCYDKAKEFHMGGDPPT